MSTRKKRGAEPITREMVLKALEAMPDRAGKRDIALALSVTGSDRILLKRIMRELEDEGLLVREKGRQFSLADTLPGVLPLEVIDRDHDGELIAVPVDWSSDAERPRIIAAPAHTQSGPTLGIGDRFLGRLVKTPDGYLATVIKHLGQSAHRVLGVIEIVDGQPVVSPVDRRSRLSFALERDDAKKVVRGDLVLVEPLAGRAAGRPRARLREKHGNLSVPGAISLIAIHEHGIPIAFPPEVIAEAEKLGCHGFELAGRDDLRQIPLVTIDPDDARDHDDAVFAAPDTDPHNLGGYIVIVAIADVAHFVRPASMLDREAKKRGNSTYFPDRVVPMLPEQLSADQCSLIEGKDRACLAVRMIFDAQGSKRSHRFVRGVMRSAARLTYGEVEDAILGQPGPRAAPLMTDIIEPLVRAFRALMIARQKREPLELEVPEFRARLGADGKVVAIERRPQLTSMKLIEEFMIAANVSAAETLEKNRIPLLYRVHEEPGSEKLQAFADFVATIGMKFAKGQVLRPSVFNRFLARAKGGPHADILSELVLRTQSQARYAAENAGHFGLHLARYAHFTSPIRRYADLIVHRGLVRAVRLGDGGLTDHDIAELTDTAERISATERRSMAAERDSINRYVAAYMQNHVGAAFDGRITGVTRFGLFVKLEGLGADGLVPISSLGSDFFRHNEKLHALVGQRSRKTYRLGDNVRVEVLEAAPLVGGLRLGLIEATKAGPRPSPKRHVKPR